MLARSRRRPVRCRAGLLGLLLLALSGCAGSASSSSAFGDDTVFLLKYVASEVGTSELAWRQHQAGQAPAEYLGVVLSDAHQGLLTRFRGWQTTIPAEADARRAARIRTLVEHSEELVSLTETCLAEQLPCPQLGDDLERTREELRREIVRWQR